MKKVIIGVILFIRKFKHFTAIERRPFRLFCIKPVKPFDNVVLTVYFGGLRTKDIIGEVSVRAYRAVSASQTAMDFYSIRKGFLKIRKGIRPVKIFPFSEIFIRHILYSYCNFSINTRFHKRNSSGDCDPTVRYRQFQYSAIFHIFQHLLATCI